MSSCCIIPTASLRNLFHVATHLVCLLTSSCFSTEVRSRLLVTDSIHHHVFIHSLASGLQNPLTAEPLLHTLQTTRFHRDTNSRWYQIGSSFDLELALQVNNARMLKGMADIVFTFQKDAI